MTTETRDLRRPITHDPDMPFVVKDLETDRLLAKFTHEDQAIDWAVDHHGLVVNTTPPTPPSTPGWYMSGHTKKPFELSMAGQWWSINRSGEWGPVDILAARAAMPLLPWVTVPVDAQQTTVEF